MLETSRIVFLWYRGPASCLRISQTSLSWGRHYEAAKSGRLFQEASVVRSRPSGRCVPDGDRVLRAGGVVSVCGVSISAVARMQPGPIELAGMLAAAQRRSEQETQQARRRGAMPALRHAAAPVASQRTTSQGLVLVGDPAWWLKVGLAGQVGLVGPVHRASSKQSQLCPTPTSP